MRKTQDLRALSEEELKAEHKDVSKEIFAMENELAIARKLEKPHELRMKKRDRARILTILNEKQRQEGS